MVQFQEPTVIDILVPVLNRPQNVKPLIKSIRENSAEEHQIMFLVSDEETRDAVDPDDVWRVICWDRQIDHEYPKKMNLGFVVSGLLPNPFLLLASDDLDFQPGWDTTALRVADETGAGVIGTNDQANGSVKRGQFSTHALVRRSYIEEHGGTMTDGPGVIFHEGYDHNFVDRELAGVAQHRGQWAFAKNSVIRHRHPNWKTAPMDSTYEKGLATFHRDQNLFFQRAHQWNYHGLNPAERRLARRAAIPGRR